MYFAGNLTNYILYIRKSELADPMLTTEYHKPRHTLPI